MQTIEFENVACKTVVIQFSYETHTHVSSGKKKNHEWPIIGFKLVMWLYIRLCIVQINMF